EVLMQYNDLERLQIQANALFIYDAQNRMLRSNEPEPENSAPRFFLWRSTMGNIWRFRDDLSDDLVAELERLAASEPVDHDLREPPFHHLAYLELLAEHAPIHETAAGPAWYLPPCSAPSRAVLVTEANKALLRAYFPFTYDNLPALSPAAMVVEDGAAVTVCASVRLTPQAAEAGLYTEDSYRGRGFGVDAVCAWANAVYASGRLPLYSTSWDNIVSQAVARRLGAVLYGADFSIT
ncbi:MAG: GNAT family N-acetyltransferase, partial [Anaerolineae bacterium]|nr:GNAT family N-acetyltransferase [Anaerolineae bacterium]